MQYSLFINNENKQQCVIVLLAAPSDVLVTLHSLVGKRGHLVHLLLFLGVTDTVV